MAVPVAPPDDLDVLDECIQLHDFDSLTEQQHDITTHHSSPYRPLEDGYIRLLRMLTLEAGQLRCEMVVQPLSQTGTYTALSYTWGGLTTEHKINVNGHDVAIRKNLWRFLLMAAASAKLRHQNLWIDQICINQDNVHERSAQVQRMASIFSTAHHVLCWLGPSHHDSNKAMDCLRMFRSSATPSKAAQVWSSTAGAAMVHLWHRSYWTRLWIVQELLVPQYIEVACGDRLAPWSWLENFWRSLHLDTVPRRAHNDPQWKAIQDTPAGNMMSRLHSRVSSISLSTMIFAVEGLHCREVLDRAYALVGAFGNKTAITPDYTMPLPILLNAILREHHAAVPPADLSDVLAYCKKLCLVFSNNEDIIFDLIDPLSRSRFDLPQSILDGPVLFGLGRMTLWWSQLYGHLAISRLLCDLRGFKKVSLDMAMKEASPLAFSMIVDVAVSLHERMPRDDYEAMEYLISQRHWDVVRAMLWQVIPHTASRRDLSRQDEPWLDIMVKRNRQRAQRIMLLLDEFGLDDKQSHDGESQTLLMQALRLGAVDTVRAILQAADVQKRGGTRWKLGDDHIQRQLSTIGVPTERPSQTQKLPEYCLRQLHCTDSNKSGVLYWAAMFASRSTSADKVKLLIETAERHSIKLPTSANDLGMTPLHVAAFRGRPDTCLHLLRYDAGQARCRLPNTNETPLDVAMRPLRPRASYSQEVLDDCQKVVAILSHSDVQTEA